MIESFVDLTYRGLALGRRIKLTQVRPTRGYLEVPMPMPVGTQIAIATDDGVTLAAKVVQIHEQVGGSDRPPGMQVEPALPDEAAQAWWQARVTPEPPPPERDARAKPLTVRPRSHTVPQPLPGAAAGDAAPITSEVTATKELSVYVAQEATAPLVSEVTATKELSVYVAEAAPDDAKRTMVMNALDQEMLAKLTSQDGVVEELVGARGDHEVVDDGKRTVAMDAVDLSALGLSASGSMPAAASGEIPAATDDDDDGGSKPTAATPSGVKKRKKRR